MVEREEGRCGVGVGDVAARAVQRLTEATGFALAGDARLDAPLAVSQRALDRVDDPLAFPALDHDPVEHDRDDAVLGPVEQEKSGDEKGTYLHPSELGRPREPGLDFKLLPPEAGRAELQKAAAPTRP